jgi:hypothetical protein
MFGYPADVKERELYWGARAIFESGRFEGFGKKQKYIPPYIDLVHDRQSFVGNEHERKQEFLDWLNKTALPALRKWAEGVSPDSRDVFVYGNGVFVLKASPNASYGYMYIGAWKTSIEFGGKGVLLEDYFEYSHTLDRDTWTVERKQ